MKKTTIALAVIILVLAGAAYAEKNDAIKGEIKAIKENKTGDYKNQIDDLKEEKRNETKTEIKRILEGISPRNLTKEEREAVKAEIKNIKEQKKSEFKAEKKELKDEKTNEVRATVHALLALENMTGIGKNVSRIAREFDNSINKTEKSLAKIEKRSKMKRFFAGGDKNSADELEAEANSNQAKINEMKKLIENCNCDNGSKEIMKEQLAEMEKEQARLKETAGKEKKAKGLFGWLWK
jgi:hypothetical protein